MISAEPPKVNCQPEIWTGFLLGEIFLLMTFPKAPDKFDKITSPSPIRENPPKSPPESVITTMPEMPTRQPKIFLKESLSD